MNDHTPDQPAPCAAHPSPLTAFHGCPRCEIDRLRAENVRIDQTSRARIDELAAEVGQLRIELDVSEVARARASGVAARLTQRLRQLDPATDLYREAQTPDGKAAADEALLAALQQAGISTDEDLRRFQENTKGAGGEQWTGR